MIRLFSYMFITTSLITLSACGTWFDGTWLEERQLRVDAQMREDNGALMTPMAPALQQSTGMTSEGLTVPDGYVSVNSSVDVMDFNMGIPSMAPHMSPNAQPPMPMAQSGFGYGAGVPAADPSVTVFPLDGDAGHLSSGYVAQSYDGHSHGYVPSYGSAENQILFKHGSSRLGGGDLRKLSSVADQAKYAPTNRITVEGYASKPTQVGSQTVESHILNLKESMNRSFAVSKTLMKKGVPAEKIKTVSYGSTKASGNDSQDRRVDVVMGER